MNKQCNLFGIDKNFASVVDIRNAKNASTFVIGRDLKILLLNHDISDIVVPPKAGYVVALMPDKMYAVVDIEGKIKDDRFASVDEACVQINHLVMESE